MNLENNIEEEGEVERTCFVTGGSGFIGYNLILELLEQDWHITCLYYPGDKEHVKKRLFDLSDDNPEKLVLVEGNVLKIETIKSGMPVEPDCVFHLAGSLALDHRMNNIQRAINVGGTRNVLEVAIEKKAKKFIQASSTSVYGENPKDLLLTEDSPKEAMIYGLNYGQTKYMAEKLVLEAAKEGKIECVCMQPNFVLGENDLVGQGFSLMYNKVYRGKLPVIPPGGGSFGDVREVVRAFVSAYENGRNGECYLLGGVNLKLYEFVALLGKEMKKKAPTFVPPKWLIYYAICALETVANCCGKTPKLTTQQVLSTSRFVGVDSSKAEKELGFKKTPVEELIKRQLKYMIDNDMFSTDLGYK